MLAVAPEHPVMTICPGEWSGPYGVIGASVPSGRRADRHARGNHVCAGRMAGIHLRLRQVRRRADALIARVSRVVAPASIGYWVAGSVMLPKQQDNSTALAFETASAMRLGNTMQAHAQRACRSITGNDDALSTETEREIALKRQLAPVRLQCVSGTTTPFPIIHLARWGLLLEQAHAEVPADA
jgi:hypothetical protein